MTAYAAAGLIVVPLGPGERSAHAQRAGSLVQTVTGTTSTGGTFAGTLTITRFVTQNGALAAVGTLAGTVLDALGAVVGTVTNLLVTIPAAVTTATCPILDLELGPLDLDVLGLVVHLDRIDLEITAQQRPGALLGNLLCAIASLLDRGGPLPQLVALLNQVLGALAA